MPDLKLLFPRDRKLHSSAPLRVQTPSLLSISLHTSDFLDLPPSIPFARLNPSESPSFAITLPRLRHNLDFLDSYLQCLKISSSQQDHQ